MKLPFVPMLATLSRSVVTGPEWVFEEKYDGIRLLAVRRSGRTTLYSRNLIDRTESWPAVALAIGRLPGTDLVLDGEVYASDRMRVSRFQLLQQQATPTFAVFDLPMLDGVTLMERPLSERRRRLEVLLRRAGRPVRLARRLPRDGASAYRMAEENGWEGIIAKRETSAYMPGVRSKDWLKVKVRHQSEFVIGGWTPPAGSRRGFGAILVGLFEGDRLRYTGKVGAGFDQATLERLGSTFGRLQRKGPAFDPVPRVRDARWVRPSLVAQVGYAEWTGDGKLRQPVYLGLRTDKMPRECRWEERE